MKNVNEKREENLRNFCDNVRFLREREGLTKLEMARKLQVSIRTVTMLERGIVPRRLSSTTVFNIYYEFGISPDDIFKKRLS